MYCNLCQLKKALIRAFLLFSLMACQNINGTSLRTNWTKQGSFLLSHTVLLKNNIIGALSEGGGIGTIRKDYLAAYSIVDGQELWRYPTNLFLNSFNQTFIAFHEVILHNNGSELVVINQEGDVLTKYKYVDGAIALSISRHTLVVDEKQNIVYLATLGKVYALDITDIQQPKPLWHKEYPKDIIWEMSVSHDGALLVALRDGDINLIKLSATGEQLWAVDSHEEPRHLYKTIDHIETDGNYIYTTIFDKLQSFDLVTGEKRWLSPNLTEACGGNTSGQIDDFLMVDAIIYATPTSGSCVFAIHKNTGELKWTLSSRVDRNAYFTFGGEPALHNGVLYVANGYLWAIDAETGEKITRHDSLDYRSQGAYIKIVDEQVLVWGTELRSYALLR